MRTVAGRVARRPATVDFPAAIFPHNRYRVGRESNISASPSERVLGRSTNLAAPHDLRYLSNQGPPKTNHGLPSGDLTEAALEHFISPRFVMTSGSWLK